MLLRPKEYVLKLMKLPNKKKCQKRLVKAAIKYVDAVNIYNETLTAKDQIKLFKRLKQLQKAVSDLNMRLHLNSTANWLPSI